MVLFKRKQVQYLTPPPIPEDAEVWAIEETGEIFTTYDSYLRRNDFYRQRRFICEITGHSNMTFREAFRSEKEASGEIADSFPEPLREPILRKVQFSQVARIDYIVDWIYEEFKGDFYPGESVVLAINDDRYTGLIKEKAKFPELARPDGTVERKAFARYFCRVDHYPEGDALVDSEHVSRERKIFTKQRIRSFLKNSMSRESWTGAPWLVKPRLAKEYRIKTDVPPQLTQEYQMKQRKVSSTNGKKGEPDGQFVNFQAYGPQSGAPNLPLKPRGKKSGAEDEQPLQFTQFLQYHQQTTNLPFHPGHGLNGAVPSAIPNGYHPIVAKGQPKAPAPPAPKYPIEDLEIPPARDGIHRPRLKFLSDRDDLGEQQSGVAPKIDVQAVGNLLETWNTLNVYCQVFQLDSFTFDDYLDALANTTEPFLQCELLVEMHCAVLKQLVNDINDQNGQIQIILPAQPESDDDDDDTDGSADGQESSSPEPEVVKPPARSTRSSLLKSEANDLRKATSNLSLNDERLHQASEMDHQARGYDWKARLRKRDFESGGWVIIIVGLLNQLAQNPRYTKTCNDILVELAPLGKEPTLETACSQYQDVGINVRGAILQVICMKSLETKAIKQYMEECSVQMTEHRKERNERKKMWKAAVDELRQLHEERRELQPEETTVTPSPEMQEVEMEETREEAEEDEGENEEEVEEEEGEEEEEEEAEEEPQASDSAPESEEGAPHQGRSLRRASDRAFARQRRAEEESQRKAAAAAEKAKKPSKEERKLEKLLAKIEKVKEQIREHEEEIEVVENDLREADCPRTKCLGKDRFWNRYYWMERNAMPFAGLPNSSTADAGYANGCVWVQGPDDIERIGFIELSDAENAQYARAFDMTVPQRKEQEEGDTHVSNAYHWGYYDDPESLDMLIGWLDNRGVREIKLRKELTSQRENISQYMLRRKEYLARDRDNNSETHEPATRISTRTKTYVDTSNHRYMRWKNTTALEEFGHLHSQPKPLTTRRQRGLAVKKEKALQEEEAYPPRQTRKARSTNANTRTSGRMSGRPSRQSTRRGS